LALFITFLTLFLKLLGLQERVPKASAGNEDRKKAKQDNGWNETKKQVWLKNKRGATETG
jgi:hypothetical protein